jgi:hypothetical protein
MTNPLVRCSACKRHIYASETSCPFCARHGAGTSGSIAAALTAAATIALTGCANDPPKTDTPTNVSPEVRKTESTQAAPNPPPQPPPQVIVPTPAPTPVTTDPAPAASNSAAMAPTPPPLPTATPTNQIDTRVAIPAYGLPPPRTTTTSPLKKPPAAAYGGPPRGTSDPLK